MSAPLFADDIVFLQRFLRCCGLFTGKINGTWGTTTDNAVNQLQAAGDAIAAQLGTFDARSEVFIRSLQPKAQLEARAFLRRVIDSGIDARIISGTRTYSEQDQLYRKGRFGDTRPIVTKAKGGHSNHNFGIAWDIGIFRNGKYLGESPLYTKAADIGVVPTLEWGGNWTSFVDRPHYQLQTGKSLAVVRTSFESGQVFV